MNEIERKIVLGMTQIGGVFLLILGGCIMAAGLASAAFHANAGVGPFDFARHSWEQGSWIFAFGASLLALRATVA